MNYVRLNIGDVQLTPYRILVSVANRPIQRSWSIETISYVTYAIAQLKLKKGIATSLDM